MITSKDKILFISPTTEDYLAISILHGLKSILPSNRIIDFPKYASAYKTGCSSSLYGKGFTIFGLLDDDEVDRWHILEKIYNEEFSLIIFSDIHRTFGTYIQLLPYLNYKNTIVLDGADTPQPYPYAGAWWRYFPYWFIPKAHTRFLYFKREWTPETIWNLWYQLFPKWLCQYFPEHKNFRPISFSIPKEKIIQDMPRKTKLFPRHIVDPEVASNVTDSMTKYAFDSEDDYYADLQASKFGITTKRAGWDCLRHYEIAANACVPCFRDLDKKPLTSAPHGLDESNCIIYRDYNDLTNKINALSEEEYQKLQHSSLEWAKANSTIERAKQLLSSLNFDPLDEYKLN